MDDLLQRMSDLFACMAQRIAGLVRVGDPVRDRYFLLQCYFRVHVDWIFRAEYLRRGLDLSRIISTDWNAIGILAPFHTGELLSGPFHK